MTDDLGSSDTDDSREEDIEENIPSNLYWDFNCSLQAISS